MRGMSRLGKLTGQIAEAGGALQGVDLVPGAGSEGKRVREFTAACMRWGTLAWARREDGSRLCCLWGGRDTQPPQRRRLMGACCPFRADRRRHGAGLGRAAQAIGDRRASLSHHHRHLLDPLSGIPVTTPARTVDDLRRGLPADRLEAVLRRAEALQLDVGKQGGFEPDLTRSELERRFLRLCRRRRFPAPEVNARVGPFVVDFLWRDRALIVETDGYRFHRGRSAFEGDRARDVELKLRGYDVVRFTHRQVISEAEAVAASLRALLARRQRRVRA